MLSANAWKQTGRISLWRYTENERNYPGWHLNGDEAGCRSLAKLLDALAADGEGGRTLVVSAPTESQLRAPNNKSGRALWVSPEKVRVVLSASPAEWSFPSELAPAVLTVGSSWLDQLREGLEGIPKGRGDFSIGGNGSLPLWFWWAPGSV
jgi:hypothetical protein